MPFSTQHPHGPVHTAHTGSWELHTREERVRYVPGWKTLLGYDEDGEYDSTRTWRSRVHPDDLVPMLGAQKAHLDGWTSCYELGFRLRDAAGHYRRVHSRGWVAVRDDDGHALRMLGTIADLSGAPQPRALAPAPSPEAVAELPQLVLDTEVVGLLRTDGGVITWTNRAATQWLGAAPGLTLDGLLVDDAQVARLRLAMQALQRHGGRQRLQLCLIHGAELRWHELTGMPVTSANGTANPQAAIWALTDITELKKEQARTEHRALHDPLTGLPNRVLLADRLALALRQADRDGTQAALAYLDLDGFKAVNDTLGHAAGDALLQHISVRLQASVRPHDTVARLGGDEFVLVLTRLASEEDGLAVLQRLLDNVQTDVDLPDGVHQVCASIGVAFHPQTAVPAAELIAVADRAMYRAKRAGGGCIEVHRHA